MASRLLILLLTRTSKKYYWGYTYDYKVRRNTFLVQGKAQRYIPLILQEKAKLTKDISPAGARTAELLDSAGRDAAVH